MISLGHLPMKRGSGGMHTVTYLTVAVTDHKGNHKPSLTVGLAENGSMKCCCFEQHICHMLHLCQNLVSHASLHYCIFLCSENAQMIIGAVQDTL